ncbi:putative ankyrin repeat domain-containing protein 19 [Manis javanica]|nr:putative ankyrin repeat domain-containing protein 19 [Manis javanica]
MMERSRERDRAGAELLAENPSKGKDLTTVNACDYASLPTAGAPKVSLVRMNWTSLSAMQVPQPHAADAPAVRRPRVRPTNVEGDCQGVNFQAQYHIRSKDVRKIHRAASKGKVAGVQQILFMGENGLNDRDKRNRTALHWACANGHAEVVTVLVERNCKLNLCDNLERTPLIKAVQCHHEDCARILLDHGADPSVSDVCGNTALHYAACGEHVTTVARLLEHTADIEASNKEGFTPLLLAVSQRNYKMTEYLLSEGADVHAVDNYERTALMLAIENGSTDIVNLLQEDVDVLSQDTHGWTGAEYTHSRDFNMYKVDKGIKNSQDKRKSSPVRAELGNYSWWSYHR